MTNATVNEHFLQRSVSKNLKLLNFESVFLDCVCVNIFSFLQVCLLCGLFFTSLPPFFSFFLENYFYLIGLITKPKFVKKILKLPSKKVVYSYLFPCCIS